MAGRALDEISTTRLSLRRPTENDVEAILAIHSDPRTCVHNPSDALETLTEATALFGRWDDHWERFGVGYWVIRRRGSNTALGFCGLKLMQFAGDAALNLFYRFDPASWGKGFATEAATAAVESAGAQFIIARVRPKNIASQRVAVRAGLVRAKHLDGPGYDGIDWIYTSPAS